MPINRKIGLPVDASWENIAFSKGGVLTTGVGTFRFPIKGGTFTIQTVAAMLGTGPGDGSILLDVNKNGTTIYGTQGNRPTFFIFQTSAQVLAHSVTTVTTGDYLTVDIDQVDTSGAAANLVVAVRLQRVS